MGDITDFIEGAAGACAADETLETVDPNAGVLAKAAAAVAGFEGMGKVKDMLEEHDTNAEAASADEASQA